MILPSYNLKYILKFLYNTTNFNIAYSSFKNEYNDEKVEHLYRKTFTINKVEIQGNVVKLEIIGGVFE